MTNATLKETRRHEKERVLESFNKAFWFFGQTRWDIFSIRKWQWVWNISVAAGTERIAEFLSVYGFKNLNGHASVGYCKYSMIRWLSYACCFCCFCGVESKDSTNEGFLLFEYQDNKEKLETYLVQPRHWPRCRRCLEIRIRFIRLITAKYHLQNAMPFQKNWGAFQVCFKLRVVQSWNSTPSVRIEATSEKCGSSGGAHRKSVTLHQSGPTIVCKSARKDLFRRGLGSLRKDPYWQIYPITPLSGHISSLDFVVRGPELTLAVYRFYPRFLDFTVLWCRVRIGFDMAKFDWCILVVNSSQFLEVTFLSFSPDIRISSCQSTLFFSSMALSQDCSAFLCTKRLYRDRLD